MMSRPATTSGFNDDDAASSGTEHCRSQIGEQLEILADAEQALLRPYSTRQRVVPRTADAAEQDGVRRARLLLRHLGIRG